MFVLFVIALACFIIAGIFGLTSEGEFDTLSYTLWAVGTILLIVIAANTVPVKDSPNIKADIPEEYWNGDIKHLEVYKRTQDSVFLRFRDTAYNKNIER